MRSLILFNEFSAPPVTKAPSVLNFYHSGSMQTQALQGGASLVMAVAAVILIGVFGLVFPWVKLSMNII